MQAPARIMQNSHQASDNTLSMDTLGIVASTLCLIHCAAMPLVITFLPILGLRFLEGHAAHHFLAGFVVAFALLAIVPGYLKHRKTSVLLSMLAGVGIVLLATFGADRLFSENLELPLITVGNLIVVMTHLRNRGLCKC
ncbi:MAG: MerC domain-containing protein [Candidatus Obscuribacterales bacterium]|nr:MerC domain-containing protein [Candidatus Obscuribacterales bacterium]